jgi:tetratricopeptide (TPR) repeat protein
MRIGLSGLMFSFALALAVVVVQAAETPSPATAEPVPAIVESASPAGRGTFDIRLEHFKETTRLRTESLEKLIERQDERIDDLHAKAGWFSMIITLLGLIIAFGAGFSYISARGKALDAVKDWMDDHGSKILERLEKQALEKIEPRIDKLEQEAQGKIDTHIQEGVKKIGALLESATEKHGQIDEVLKRARVSVQEPGKAEISKDDKEEIDRAAKEIEAKPESERTYRDWEVRALSAYASGDYQIAAENFENAAKSIDATLAQIAMALLNKAIVWRESGDYEASVVAFDDVLRRFGDADEPKLREQVAMALSNKGVALRESGDYEAAVAAYDDVLRRFGDAKEPKLREQVAKALFNKGFALRKSGDYEAAVAAYDDVVSRFGDADEPKLREPVAKALNGKSYARLLLAKQAWQSPGKEDEARALLSTALADAEASLEIAPDNPIMLGNKGYALFLLGREDDAKPELRRALELGGEEMREGELEDAGKHPLPQDEEFKDLINSLWDEVSKD